MGNRSSHTFLDPQVAGEFHMAKKSCKEQGWDVGGIDESLKQEETVCEVVNKFGVPGNSKRPSVETRSNHPPQKLREIAGILLNKTNQSNFKKNPPPFPQPSSTAPTRSNLERVQCWCAPLCYSLAVLAPWPAPPFRAYHGASTRHWPMGCDRCRSRRWGQDGRPCPAREKPIQFFGQPKIRGSCIRVKYG